MKQKAGTHLPEKQKNQLARAARLEWISIGYAAGTITLIALVMGNSQAMRTAWVEDMLSVLPQIAFLVALFFTRGTRNPKHPYGYHRSMSAGHLVAGVALLVVGSMLAYESVSALVKLEHPTIGTVNLWGNTIWQGWLMIGAMVVIVGPAVILGRLKIKAAAPMNNKLLHADAAMAKADWQTNAASIVGVAGIAIGWWWLDAVAAAVISAGILKDGWNNARAATVDLLDRRATTIDGQHADPLIEKMDRMLRAMPWVERAVVRARELGQVLHVEAFVVPRDGQATTIQLANVRNDLAALDWKIYDVVVTIVDDLPDYLHEPEEA